MQDVVGTKPSKWCAGCHDHAVFFNGRFDRPIKEQIDTPEAQAGLGCISCHSITARGQLDGQRRLHHRVSAAARAWPAARTGTSARSTDFLTYLDPGAAPQDVHEAVHAAGPRRVLLDLPQGAPRRAGEQLPLVPRLQRLRQLAGQRRLRPGRALVLLPAEVADLRRTATCRWSTSNDPGNRDGKVHSPPLPGRQHGAGATSTRTRSSWR